MYYSFDLLESHNIKKINVTASDFFFSLAYYLLIIQQTNQIINSISMALISMF